MELHVITTVNNPEKTDVFLYYSHNFLYEAYMG